MAPTSIALEPQPQTDWPIIKIGPLALFVRWTFYTQWLLSARGVSVKGLAAVLAAKDAGMVDLLMQCFAAAVAENYTRGGQPAPTADFWAQQISEQPNAMEVWQLCVKAVFEAVGKVRPAASPGVPKNPAQTPGT